jgi:hypothetical protein
MTLRIDDAAALREIRGYFDEISYGYVAHQVVPGADAFTFAPFQKLQKTFERLSPLYRLLFSLFWLGHGASESILQRAIPPSVLDAMIAAGLLAQDDRGVYATPGVAVVPVQGLYMLVGLPPYYGTTQKKDWAAPLLPSIAIATQTLPASLAGKRVLDAHSQSALYALLCAARGARNVVALVNDDEVLEIARFNVALNGFSGVVTPRRSELFEALADGEAFDLVVAQPPTTPVADALPYPRSMSGGEDGLRVLKPLFEGLGRWLAPDGQALVLCGGALGDQYSINLNRNVLSPVAERDGLLIRAYVDKKTPFKTFEDTLVQHVRDMSYGVPLEQVRKLEERLAHEGRAHRLHLQPDRPRLEGTSRKGTLQCAGVQSDQHRSPRRAGAAAAPDALSHAEPHAAPEHVRARSPLPPGVEVEGAGRLAGRSRRAGVPHRHPVPGSRDRQRPSNER